MLFSTKIWPFALDLQRRYLSNAQRALEAFLESVKVGIANDGKVQLVGFGTFSVAERKARKGVNPQTGKSIDIPASKTVKFKVSKEITF